MTSIIEELNNKWNQEESIHVANMSVNGILYTINVGKVSKNEGYGEIIDNSINLYCTKPEGKEKWTEETLQGLFEDFYLKPVDGTWAISTTDTSGKQLNCKDVEFGEIDNVSDAVCTTIDFTIIEQINGLADGSDVEVAKVSIDSQEYTIKFKKLAEGQTEYPTIDITNHIITISSVDVPTDSSTLSTLISNNIKIGGTYQKPVIDISGASLNCADSLFSEITPQSCTKIDLPKTIIDQVKELTGSSPSLTIAKVQIDNEEYTIKFKKDSADPAIDTSSKEIIISSVDAPTDSSALSTLIGEYYVQKSAGKLKIDSEQDNAKKLDCDASLFNKTAIDNCTNISLKKETIQEKNLAELEELKDTCGDECPYSDESFDKAAITIQYFPEEMIEQEVENIVKSFEVMEEGATKHSDEELDNALECLLEGGVNCEIEI